MTFPSVRITLKIIRSTLLFEISRDYFFVHV